MKKWLLPFLTAFCTIACVTAFVACDDPTGTLTNSEAPNDGNPDDGNPDGGNPDDGNPDGGNPDDGNPDDGNPDGGNPDGGNPDGGNPDDGNPDDGNPDGGNPDGGNPDDGNPDDGNPDDGDEYLPEPEYGENGIIYLANKEWTQYTVIGVEGNPESLVVVSDFNYMPVVGFADGAFDDCDNLQTIYFYGDETQWEEMQNTSVVGDATVYFHTYREPPAKENLTGYDGNYWHMVDDEPTIWEWTYSTQGLRYELSEDGEYAKVTGYYGSDTKIVVASEYQGVPVTHVGEGAFYGKYFEVVVLPDSITTLEREIFWNSTVCEIYFPDSITTVDEDSFSFGGEPIGITFYRVTCPMGMLAYLPKMELQECTITSGTVVPENAFKDCQNLLEVVLPAGITKIEKYAFHLTPWLNSIMIQGQDCDRDKIYIPQDVTVIEDWAFCGVGRAREIVFHDNITEIGEYAFNSCHYLREVTIPDSVEKIGERAFARCNSLKNVFIPANVSEMGECTFSESGMIENISVALDNEYYASKDGALYNKDYTTLLRYTTGNIQERFVVPDTVTKIAKESVSGAEWLKEIVVGDSVKELDDYAFLGCMNVETISIGKGLETIGECVFNNLDLLTGISVSYENPYLVSYNGDLYTSGCEELIAYCTGKADTEYVTPDGLKKIRKRAFSWVDNLQSITIREGVTEIGEYALGCQNVTSLSLPDGLETIKEGGLMLLGISALVIPDSVTELGESALPINLSDITATLDIMEQIFSEYHYSQAKIKITSGTVISEEFFKRANHDTVILPDGIKELKDRAFSEARIGKLVLPDSIEILGEQVFYSAAFSDLTCSTFVLEDMVANSYICISLGRVEITSGEELPEKAFFDGYSLTEVILPNTMKRIGNHAFAHCWGLETITLPDSVEYIEFGAFKECRSLKTIQLGDNVKEVEDDVFYECEALQAIYLPNVEAIGSRAFDWCISLETIVVGDKLTSIAEKAFRDCKALKSLYLVNVETIPANALEGCSSLETLVLGTTVKSIGDKALKNCGGYDFRIYYMGTEEEFSKIAIGNENDGLGWVLYYSENEPTEQGSFWRMVDGVPTFWEYN